VGIDSDSDKRSVGKFLTISDEDFYKSKTSKGGGRKLGCPSRKTTRFPNLRLRKEPESRFGQREDGGAGAVKFKFLKEGVPLVT